MTNGFDYDELSKVADQFIQDYFSRSKQVNVPDIPFDKLPIFKAVYVSINLHETNLEILQKQRERLLIGLQKIDTAKYLNKANRIEENIKEYKNMYNNLMAAIHGEGQVHYPEARAKGINSKTGNVSEIRVSISDILSDESINEYNNASYADLYNNEMILRNTDMEIADFIVEDSPKIMYGKNFDNYKDYSDLKFPLSIDKQGHKCVKIDGCNFYNIYDAVKYIHGRIQDLEIDKHKNLSIANEYDKNLHHIDIPKLLREAAPGTLDEYNILTDKINQEKETINKAKQTWTQNTMLQYPYIQTMGLMFKAKEVFEPSLAYQEYKDDIVGVADGQCEKLTSYNQEYTMYSTIYLRQLATKFLAKQIETQFGKNISQIYTSNEMEMRNPSLTTILNIQAEITKAYNESHMFKSNNKNEITK